METGEGIFFSSLFFILKTIKHLNIENLISDFINTLADKPEMEKRQRKMRHDHLYEKIYFYIKVGLLR